MSFRAKIVRFKQDTLVSSENEKSRICILHRGNSDGKLNPSYETLSDLVPPGRGLMNVVNNVCNFPSFL